MKKNVKVADLFCGAGGSTHGAVAAFDRLGMEAQFTAINHWPVAVETHTMNHPKARHLCTSEAGQWIPEILQVRGHEDGGGEAGGQRSARPAVEGARARCGHSEPGHFMGG